jgi:hypothetical protein
MLRPLLICRFRQPGLSFVPALVLAISCTTTKPQVESAAHPIPFAPRALKIERWNGWYPDASKRAHETGEVIVHFNIGTDGNAREPFVIDKSTRDMPRLMEAAQKLLRDSRYESGEHFRHEVTASILFELTPCGTLKQTEGLDYYVWLCIDPIKPVMMDVPIA